VKERKKKKKGERGKPIRYIATRSKKEREKKKERHYSLEAFSLPAYRREKRKEIETPKRRAIKGGGGADTFPII